MKVRRLGSRRAVAVLPASGVLILLAAACSSGAGSDASASHSRATRPADPPLLIPWSRVGDIALEEPKARVEREYGSPGHGYHVQARISNGIQGYYGFHGRVVAVKFRGGRGRQQDPARPMRPDVHPQVRAPLAWLCLERVQPRQTLRLLDEGRPRQTIPTALSWAVDSDLGPARSNCRLHVLYDIRRLNADRQASFARTGAAEVILARGAAAAQIGSDFV